MSTTADLLEATITTRESGLGPTDVEAPISPLSNPNLSTYFARRDFLIDAHRAWKDRVRHVTLVANGFWHKVWPDLTREPLAPTVANIIELAIAHSGAVGGSIVPSVKVPVPFSQQGAEGERGARKRERRIRELREKSNYPVLLAQLWQDYDGAGACAIGVWANFDEPDPAKRNPYYVRFDPRHYYPVKDSQGNVVEFLVARKRTLYDVTREYPNLQRDKLTAAGDEVEEWFWFTKDEFLHAIVDLPQKDPKKRGMVVLARVPNKMSRVPVVEIVRPTFDGERRGKFDQTIHILRTAHQLMALTIERTAEEVYPAVAGFDVEGLEKFGPGATMQYRTMEGRIDVFSPQQMFDVKDLIARLEENARVAARYPQQLTGDPGASIASSRAIMASMGALDASLALTHRQFEWGLAIADSLALEMDEVYCLDPATPVLTADLRWVPVGELKVGDKLLAFDENSTHTDQRGWRVSEVLSTRRVIQPTYKVTLSDGTETIASANHRWLVTYPSGMTKFWAHTTDLKVGYRVPRLIKEWDDPQSWEAGYVAGVLDGEGTLGNYNVVSEGKTLRLSFAQRENEVLETTLRILDAWGFDYSIRNNVNGKDVKTVYIKGGRSEVLRLLGMTRPQRLLAKLDADTLGRVTAIDNPEIVSIEFLGYREVVAMETSTGTLVAQGFGHHNCDGPKTIYGDARDRKKPESFTPSRDIAGHYEVTVSYGLGAGSDPANREIRLSMHLRDRLISRNRARQELDFLEDEEQEEVLLAKEAMLDAVVQGILSMAAAGDPELAALFFTELNNPETTMEEKVVRVMKRLQEKAAQAAQAAAPAPEMGAPVLPEAEGLSAPVEADSLARGGLPGNAEGLPPLPAILGPTAPRQL